MNVGQRPWSSCLRPDRLLRRQGKVCATTCDLAPSSASFFADQRKFPTAWDWNTQG
jgi:hypothetical protein